MESVKTESVNTDTEKFVEIGCFRNEDCQYLHKQIRDERQKTQYKEDKTKENIEYKCNHCHFKSARKGNKNIHVKTKHERLIKMESENVQDFIYRFKLEKYSHEYQKYFKENDFAINKNDIEKIIATFGRNCILEFEN